ncbi:inositol 1,4,5-trisphosphate receptor-interacting protein [Trichomycterus rosablanca]|uniref:inositol 1,4,5-trisphosphate receptor-interacting protein n=1 Tax=Trichomycterus rosablanca TaxID=2290929 RepID=UPI002F3537BA
MEEMFLRVCVLVVSLLYIKDHTVLEGQDEDVIMVMQEREDLLQKEATKLEQEVHSLATDLQHSNQEVLQGEESDVQQMVPNGIEEKSRKDQNILHHNLLIKDKQNELQNDKMISVLPDNVSQKDPNADNKVLVLNETLSSEEGTQTEIVRTGQNKSKNIQSKDSKVLGQEDVPAPTDVQKPFTSDSVAVIDKRIPSQEKEKGLKDGGDLQTQAKANTALNSEELPGTEQISNQKSEDTYTWYFWKVLSLLSVIRLLRKCLSSNSKMLGMMTSIIKGKTVSVPLATKISLPDSKVMTSFYDQCVQIPPNMSGQVCEFVEGFVDELLEAARESSSEEVNMQIGDFIGVGSIYETWATGKSMVCDLYVPITAPTPYGFEVEFLKGHKDFGQIKMVKTENISNGCPCMDGNLDEDDTLCLLHPHNEVSKVIKDAIGGMLCQANTPYLAKRQVVRWFRTLIKNAWTKISHKYEFELAFRNQVAPGALRVRFRSGWVILFNITPVVQVEESKVYLVSHLCNLQDISDTDWPVSFTSYEKALLQYFSNILPSNSCHIQCLQILSFLHKKQNDLTGKCSLTSYHLKSTLLNLLLTHKPMQWESDKIADRLKDMLTFLEQRLQEGTFYHALLGNSHVPGDIKLPKDFQTAKPTNIFLPLASDRDPVQHLQELIQNAPVLIQEYVSMAK